MMFYTKSPPKLRLTEEEIQPWSSDESKMLNLIIESAEAQAKHLKKMNNHLLEEHKLTPCKIWKEGQSYNFYTNLRKYERKKAQDFFTKKDVNFIQRNIRGLSEDFPSYRDVSPKSLVNKMIQEKHQKSKIFQNEFKQTIQPINWSLVMQYQEEKSQKRHKHKAIQNFNRFLSQKKDKTSRKPSLQQKFDNIEEMNQFEVDKYQKLLRLRQGLRKRKLKDSQQTRKLFQNALSIDDICKSANSVNNNKYICIDKTSSRMMPNTSQSLRKNGSIQIDNLNKSSSILSTKKSEKIEPRMFYTSHRNRINTLKKVGENKLH